MRILHTSDWHLGRLLHGVYMTEDQEVVLGQLTDLITTENPGLVILSGDVYDRAVPPHAAVALLDCVLTRIINELQTPMMIIAGNHDGPDRLAFGSSIFRERGLHIFGNLKDAETPVELEDAHGKVAVFGLPYAEPSQFREHLGRDDLNEHGSAMAAMCQKLSGQLEPGTRTVLAAHAFSAGGRISDSERPLTIGGAGTVDASIFEPFDYTALGHLHAPQAIATNSAHYSGSLLKYSFSEADHRKSVTIVEMDADGACEVTLHDLKPRHDLRIIEGAFADVLANGAGDVNKDDYVKVVLSDRKPVFEAMSRLREVYPNTLQVERPALETEDREQSIADVQKMSESALFGIFFEDMLGEAPTEEEMTLFSGVMDQMATEEREAGV